MNAISSLQANRLATQSKLFIFSDAPRPGDEEEVARVRKYASTIGGFGSVTVVERTENDRVKNNRGGIEHLLQRYGRCIYLEEDVIVAPAFLNFMNEGLEHFSHHEKVFAVCGYTPPIDVGMAYKSNAYMCRRFSAWGFGIWADTYEKIQTGTISEKHLSPLQRWRLRTAGMDLLRMVDRMSRNELEALDVRINFTMAMLNMSVICPTNSLTINRGHDGTGLHCVNTDYYETLLDNGESAEWEFSGLTPSPTLDKALYFYRGQHLNSLKNSILYHLTRGAKFGK